MNCPQAKEHIPDYLAGNLDGAARAALEHHLEECAACREEHHSLGGLWTRLSSLPEATLSPDADRRFHAMLAAYRSGLDQKTSRRRPRFNLADWIQRVWPTQPAWQWAGVLALFIILVGGGMLAGWNLRSGGMDRGAASGAAVAQLRQEILDLKGQMAIALLEQKSVSERLRGVEWTARLQPPDAQVLSALLRALDTDPNVNVRLAVVGALQPYASQTQVRQTLLSSLPRQPSPLIQVELIHMLVNLDEKGLIPVLKSMMDNQDTDTTVRERAKWGLAQLG
jgi:hypothetical protein